MKFILSLALSLAFISSKAVSDELICSDGNNEVKFEKIWNLEGGACCRGDFTKLSFSNGGIIYINDPIMGPDGLVSEINFVMNKLEKYPISLVQEGVAGVDGYLIEEYIINAKFWIGHESFENSGIKYSGYVKCKAKIYNGFPKMLP